MNSLNEVKIVLAGIGGYGTRYVRSLLQGEGKYPIKLVGAVDPYAEKSPCFHLITERNIPIYPSLERFYEVSGADMAIISTPIQYHCPHTCLALSHGSHVLCEKPLSATVDEAIKMIEARNKANKIAAIGYQWSYSEEIQALKQDIIRGLYGKPIRLKTLILWPRSETYYARGWAGKKRDSSGNLILDSVANNATAHYIHNMFYVLGSDVNTSARPSSVTAELYRANDIENYDTAALKAYTDNGAELLYYGSHAVDKKAGARFHYAFEKADIFYDDETGGKIIAHFHNGEKKDYGNPNLNSDNKIWSAVAAILGEGEIVCGLEAAMSQTICINAMQQSGGDIAEFPERMIRRGALFRNNDKGLFVEGLADRLKACYDQAALPAETGIDWAKAGELIRLN
ncbi:Gfo/Idh/MocA family protein [Paenibacillus tarimensis]